MPQPNDLSRSLVALDQDSTIIAVVEMSQSSWLVAGMLPGIERQPRKKLEPSPERLLGLLHGWRDEAVKAGRKITRIALAFEAGRDGFWLARWLRAHGVEAHVIHPSSVAVSREHRRAKTDRLDTELLKRGFLGWLRGERGHCTMARIPTGAPDESGAKRREQGLARAGNARVRRGMIQLAWRFLRFQKESALARWYQARTADSRIGTRKTMIVALARKLVIALWRFVTAGETLEGVILRPAG
jgi:transposase